MCLSPLMQDLADSAVQGSSNFINGQFLNAKGIYYAYFNTDLVSML
jgi:hypothetical protein